MHEGGGAICSAVTNDAPTQRADLASREADLRDLLDTLETERAQVVAGALSCDDVGQGPASRPAEQSGIWPFDELTRCLQRGENGDASSARRAAELLELIEDYAGAVAWWHRAAELGDGDAIDYVRVILT